MIRGLPMKVFFIFLEIALIISLFLYLTQRINEQHREIMELKDRVHKTQVKGATDNNEIRLKYYELQRLLNNNESPKK